MKFVITTGGQKVANQSVIELNERWSGPASTKWLHRHPRLYWATLRGPDRFRRFLKPYLVNPSQGLRTITLELKAGHETDAFSTLAYRIFGHRPQNEPNWVEQSCFTLSNYVVETTGFSVATRASFQGLVKVRPLDLVRLSCNESLMVGPNEAISMGSREPLSLRLIHSSSSIMVYELTPTELSLYFIALLVIAIKTDAIFVAEALESSGIDHMEGRAAQNWYIGASAAEKLIAMGHTACQVAGLFVPACRGIIDQLAESKELVATRPGGRARELVENMAAAMHQICEAGYYEFGSSFAASGAPYLNGFLRELTLGERADIAMYLAGCVQPLVMISHAQPFEPQPPANSSEG